jgi:hypothetical protein
MEEARRPVLSVREGDFFHSWPEVAERSQISGVLYSVFSHS